MKNYYVHYEIGGKRMKMSACGKDASEVYAIFKRVYPTAKFIGLERVKPSRA